MIWLTKKQLIFLHSEIVKATGGSDGLREEGILESALVAPFQSYGGVDLFPSVISKAARLACGLTENHPFVDGNKRIGAHAMLVVLNLNGVELSYTQDEFSAIFLQLASGTISFEGLREWLKSHLRKGFIFK